MEISETGDKLLSLHANNQAQLWDLGEETRLRSYPSKGSLLFARLSPQGDRTLVERSGANESQVVVEVFENSTGALLRQGPAEALPAHRLVEEVMLTAEGRPALPGRARLLDRAAAIMSGLEESLQDTLAPAQAGLRGPQVMSPAPAMGAGGAAAGPPRGLPCPAPPAPGGLHSRRCRTTTLPGATACKG